MNTFSSDYISNSQVGLTSNVVKSIPRQVSIPVKLPVFTKNHKKTIKEIKNTLLKIADVISKVA